jgi:hypothetical protein
MAPMGSKNVAVWMIYKDVSDDYWLFFILYEFDFAYWRLTKEYSMNLEISQSS